MDIHFPFLNSSRFIRLCNAMKDETHYGRIGLCFLACKRETKFLNFYPVLCCTEQMKEVWNINFCSVYAKNKLHICVLLWNTFHRIFRNSTPCKPMGVRYLKEIYQEIGGKRLTKRNKINMRFFDMLMWIKNYLKMISIIIGSFWLILKNIFITKIDHLLTITWEFSWKWFTNIALPQSHFFFT